MPYRKTLCLCVALLALASCDDKPAVRYGPPVDTSADIKAELRRAAPKAVDGYARCLEQTGEARTCLNVLHFYRDFPNANR